MDTSYTLDELELPLIIHTTMAPLADVIAGPVELNVKYDYEPGQHEILRPDPNDSQPGFPDSVGVYEVTAAEPLLFDNEGITLTLAAGFDLTSILPRAVFDRIEHDLIMSIRNHREAA